MDNNTISIGQFPLQKAIIFEAILLNNKVVFRSIKSSIEGFELVDIFVNNSDLKKALQLKDRFDKEEVNNNIPNNFINSLIVKVLSVGILTFLIVFTNYTHQLKNIFIGK